MKHLILSLIIIFLANCSVNPVTGKQDFVMISENQEIQMGREYNAQILKQSPRYQDQNLQEYVQSIGESLASKSHRPNLIYRFTVIVSLDYFSSSSSICYEYLVVYFKDVLNKKSINYIIKFTF